MLPRFCTHSKLSLPMLRAPSADPTWGWFCKILNSDF